MGDPSSAEYLAMGVRLLGYLRKPPLAEQLARVLVVEAHVRAIYLLRSLETPETQAVLAQFAPRGTATTDAPHRLREGEGSPPGHVLDAPGRAPAS